MVPLAESECYAFFIAGRDRAQWGANQYRLGRKTKHTVLELFGIESTRQQIMDSKFGGFAAQIVSLTNGHPDSNELVVKLLADIERFENVTIRDRNFGDYESRLVEAVLEHVKKDRNCSSRSIPQILHIVGLAFR